jgi:FkbM family methyltransferase
MDSVSGVKPLSQARASTVRLIERLGLRAELQAMNERWSPLPSVRRDGRDRRHIEVALASTLRPGDLCVDVGANVGTITRLMVRLAPQGRHVLIEPLTDLADALRRRFPSCEVHAVALADRPGLRSFVRVIDRPTRSGLRPTQLHSGAHTEEIEVPVTTLDDLLGDARPRVVKIDVEGAELEVLRGSMATLHESRPLVLFERLARDLDLETGAIHDLLDTVDYRIFDIDGQGPLDREAFLSTCRAGRIWNYMATPG